MPTAAQPTIVFLHGFAESREVWTEFTRPFPAAYRLLAPNLLGHGTSVGPVPDFSMEAQARYVIDHLGRRNATVADELPDPPTPPKGTKEGTTQPE